MVSGGGWGEKETNLFQQDSMKENRGSDIVHLLVGEQNVEGVFTYSVFFMKYDK